LESFSLESALEAKGKNQSEPPYVGSYEYILNDNLIGHFEGLIGVSADSRLAQYFPGRFYFGISNADDMRRATPNVPLIANFPVHYETSGDRIKFDILQSIRTRTL